MKQIPLTQGKFALVDDEDYVWLIVRKWRVEGGYASSGSKGDKIWMHREILSRELKPGLVPDHINRDCLDNRRSNLRVATYRQNSQNRTVMSGKRFLGVGSKKDGGFTACISVDWRRVYLGTFRSEEDAAVVYNRAAKKYHKEFANLNDVVDDGREISPRKCWNSTGFSGVSKSGAKWQASVNLKGSHKYLGVFPTPELASAAVQNFKAINQTKS